MRTASAWRSDGCGSPGGEEDTISLALSLVSQQANTLHTHQLSHTLEHLITSPHHLTTSPPSGGTPRRQWRFASQFPVRPTGGRPAAHHARAKHGWL